MKQNINIEAEGNELILKNKAGDYVIVPKKYRLEVQDMIKENCHGCIDELVETLPVMEDYAEDGSLLPDWDKVKVNLNPKNWGAKDYTDKGDWKTAFSAARQAGEKEFMWNNKRFNTKSDMSPEQQMKVYGITDAQLQNRNFIQDRLSNNLNPRGYELSRKNNGKIYERIINAVIKNKQEPERNLEYSGRLDAFNLYTGKPQLYNTFEVSKYKPSLVKDGNSDVIYYKISDNAKNQYSLIDPTNYSQHMLKYLDDSGNIKSKEELSRYDEIAGNYTINKGSDENGTYISYYDKWDLNPYSLRNPINKKEITTDFGKPFEIYDRIYYRENPKYSKAENDNIVKRVARAKAELAIIDNENFKSEQIPGTFDYKYITADNKPFNVPKEFEDIWKYREHLYKESGLQLTDKYIRQYYSDKELSELDIDKKNFDTLALQRELSNRGYKLPKSTKEDNTFDGVWGDETKNALLEYRKSQNKNGQ